MKTTRLLPCAAIALSALCGSDAEANGYAKPNGVPAVEIRMEMGEYFFSPSILRLVGGLPYVLRLENTGEMEHEFDAPALAGVSADSWVEVFGADGKAAAKIYGAPDEMVVFPGESVAWHFTPLHSLEAGIVCDLPGHREQGMVGRVIVRAAP